MLSLTGRGYPVRGGIQASDDRRGDIITGEVESQGEWFGVWGGNGNGVAVSTSPYIAREDRRMEAAM